MWKEFLLLPFFCLFYIITDHALALVGFSFLSIILGLTDRNSTFFSVRQDVSYTPAIIIQKAGK